MLYSVRDYVCDLYYVSNVIRLGGPLLFLCLLIFHTFQVLDFIVPHVHEHSLMATLGSAAIVHINSFASSEEMAQKKNPQMQKAQKIVSLGIEPRTFPEHLLIAFVNGKS